MYAFFRVHKSFQSSFKYAMLAKCPSIERHCRFTHRTFLTLEKCQNKHVCHSQFSRIYYSSAQEGLAVQKPMHSVRKRAKPISPVTNITEITPSSIIDKQTKLVRYNANQLCESATMQRQSQFSNVSSSKTKAYPAHLFEAISPQQISFQELEEMEETDEVIEHAELEVIKETVNAKNQRKKILKPSSPAITTKNSYNDAKQIALDRAIYQNLFAFINVCCLNDWANSAYNVLLNHRKSSIEKRNKFKNAKLFAIVLEHYASKGNFRRVSDILKVFEEDKIPLSSQIFANVIECLGRRLSTKNMALLRCYIKEAESNGITMNRIMEESQFVRDQREVVLNTIRSVDPNFQPIYTPPVINYDNPLVNALNCSGEKTKRIEFQEESNSKDGEFSCSNKAKFSPTEISRMINEQLEIELRGSLTIKSICNISPHMRIRIDNNLQKIENLFDNWRTCIAKSFKRDSNSLYHQNLARGFHSVNINPYLRALSTNHYVELLIDEIKYLVKNSASYTPTTSQLYSNLGKKVLMRYQIEMRIRNGLIDKTRQIHEEYCNKILGDNNDMFNARQIWQRLEYNALESGPSLDVDDQKWPYPVTHAIGRFLFNILLRDIKIDNTINQPDSKKMKPFMVPVFYTLLRSRNKVLNEEIKVHPVFSNLYRNYEKETLTMEANMIPMVCPPLPWINHKRGAYLMICSDLIRLPPKAFDQLNRIEGVPKINMYPALDSLNQLAKVPWKINTRVLDILLEVFNSNGNEKLGVPQPSSIADDEYNEKEEERIRNGGGPKTKAEKYYDLQELQQRRGELHSLWCEAHYRLSLANHYRDKTFWLPQNMDFRGRVYPLPPNLNHIGSDLSRCLFLFHEGRPLGEHGYRWIKLHCINLTGLKKKDSIEDRLRYFEEVFDDILDSADNPLTGRMWWTNSDDPWQTLACCIEIANIHRCPDPKTYMCQLPIHQDGSCNGLQHYAALGRDQIGAISVNLCNMQKPQDVYLEVANKVEEIRCKDAAAGNEIAQVLDGFITRKVIKQTVMTTVYGVTRFGARLQIERQLKYLDDFPAEHVMKASNYLTTKTFESLQAMFTSAKEIQDWFTQCARLISGVRLKNVEWVTPLGLPVVQPYSKMAPVQLRTKHSSTTDNKFDLYEKPIMNKQKNAFPPNFIHSLDSTHMMLTSLNCEKSGMTFVSVHDCFWTHPSTVAEMNRICREQFVLLHSQPILEDLSAFFLEHFGYTKSDFLGDASDMKRESLNSIVRSYPKQGQFRLEDVLDSVYFFS